VKPYVLLAEDQEELRDAMQIAVESFYEGLVLAVGNASEAIEIMRLEGRAPELVISDFEMPGGNGDVLFRYIKEKFPDTPFILSTGNPRGAVEPLFPGALAILQKPEVLIPLKKLFKQLFSDRTKPKPFLPLRLSLLVKLGVLPFDLFIKLSDENFVKVHNRGDSFLPEDGKKYIERNIIDLYIRDEDAGVFLREFHLLAEMSLNSTSVSPEELVLAGADFLDASQKLAQAFGWTEEVVASAQRSVAIAIKAVSANPSIMALLEARATHGSSKAKELVTHTCLLSCAISQKLEWASELTQVKLSMAALLHDITLEEHICEEMDKWNERARDRNDNSPEVKAYREHARAAAEKVREIPNLPPDLDQIVLQHHERPDGSGFPQGISAHRISPLSAILIFAEDLSWEILDSPEPREAAKEFARQSEKRYSGGAFRKIYKAFSQDTLGEP
jgi:response regulator RpfG family c-di-GMP phosphodiesterase